MSRLLVLVLQLLRLLTFHFTRADPVAIFQSKSMLIQRLHARFLPFACAQEKGREFIPKSRPSKRLLTLLPKRTVLAVVLVNLFSLAASAADELNNVESLPSEKASSKPKAQIQVASNGWLIVTQNESVAAGSMIQVEVVKPIQLLPWPKVLTVRLSPVDLSALPQERTLTLLEQTTKTRHQADVDTVRRSYQFSMPDNFSGLTRAELLGVKSNRLALWVDGNALSDKQNQSVAGVATQMPRNLADAFVNVAAIPLANQIVNSTGKPVLTTSSSPGGSQSSAAGADNHDAVLSPNEPVYLLLGTRGGENAQFQLSLKYRIFDPDSTPAEWLPALANVYMAYTQTSLWDLSANSKPFRDTSYRPGFFWQTEPGGQGFIPSTLRLGYEHESNGKDGASSRSVDMLFVRPIWRKTFNDGSALVFAPKIYGYLDKKDNADIQRYRGYADWVVRYGYGDGWLMSSQLRYGTAHHSAIQMDFSVPFRKPIFDRTGGFLMLQLYSGYGETLLDYNVKRKSQLRIGFSIVR